MSDLEDVFETPSQAQQKTRRYILIFIFVLLLIIISVGAYQYLSSSEKQQASNIVPTPTAKPTTIPTPTLIASPTASLTQTASITTATPKASATPSVRGTTIDKSSLTIAVQNGTGVGGAAKKAADILKNLGYTVSSTGNADEFTYEKTIIQIKPSKKSFLSQLRSDIEKTYVVESATADLTESAATDAVIIVGK